MYCVYAREYGLVCGEYGEDGEDGACESPETGKWTLSYK